MLNLKSVKTGVFGIQGSGKTYLVEHNLITSFKKPIVYLMHPEDFKSCKSNVTVYIPMKKIKGKMMIDKSAEHLDKFLGEVIELIKKENKYDAVIIDEADLFLPKDTRALQKYPNINDLVDNHRHYGKEGIGFIYITRRPQDISTMIVETSEHLFLFAIEGKNINAYMRAVHQDYEELMPQLKKQNHNFIHKQLGEKPKIFSKVSMKQLNP